MALARLAEAKGDLFRRELAAFCVFDILPHVVKMYPQLQKQKHEVLSLFRRVLWQDIDLHGVEIDVSPERFDLLQSQTFPPDHRFVGAADVYVVHAREIAKARLGGGKVPYMLESDLDDRFSEWFKVDNPPSASDWLYQTCVRLFVEASFG